MIINLWFPHYTKDILCLFVDFSDTRFITASSVMFTAQSFQVKAHMQSFCRCSTCNTLAQPNGKFQGIKDYKWSQNQSTISDFH